MLDSEEPDFQQRVRQGSLRQLYEEWHTPDERKKALNAIGLPLPDAGVVRSTYSSDVRAFYRTKNDFACIRSLPTASMNFALAATPGAHHWWHIDSRGDGTMVGVDTGQKVWAVAGPKDEKDLWSTTVWSTEEVDTRSLKAEKWNVEIIVLNPGDRL